VINRLRFWISIIPNEFKKEMQVPFSIILATDSQNGIGKDNSLPWKIREDLLLFSRITRNNVVIMGRKTWDSLPLKPLPRRINIVVSRSPKPDDLPEGVLWTNNIEDADIQSLLVRQERDGKEIFCIGGAGLLRHFEKYKSMCERMHIHQINKQYDCDTFFPLHRWTENMYCSIENRSIVKDKNTNENVYYSQYIWRKIKSKTERSQDQLRPPS
jgi:dihydrofolate reductase